MIAKAVLHAGRTIFYLERKTKLTLDFKKLQLPTGELLTDDATRKDYGQNKFTQEIINGNKPAAVIVAKSVSDVQATVKFANQQKVAVTVYGSGTSIVNGSAGHKMAALS